jgi:transglutaminase-like putative cysteine protease
MTGVSSSSTSAMTPGFLPGAELALTALTAATVLGFWRVFDRGSFLGPMLGVALVTHLILAVGRRRSWTVPLVALVSVPAATLVCIWLVFPGTTKVGIPTSRTYAAMTDALTESWTRFSNVLAPAEPDAGFVVASCAALFFAVFLADWAAFRLWSSFEAVVPATTLFVFCAVLAADHRLVSAAAYLSTLLLFLLLHRAARQESSMGWLVNDHGPTTATSVRRSGPVPVGAALIAIAVLAGTLVGPLMPGAGSEPALRWRPNAQAAGERKAISPLVDIRDRMLNQPETPLFTVRANKPVYWRLTSLETFDGDIWKSQARYGKADGDLPGDVAEGDVDLLDQRFTITNLDMLWAPAAFKPVRVVESNVGLSYNEDSSTLIVEPGASLMGESYSIQSKFTQPTIEQLATVTSDEIPEDIRRNYLGLPSDFSDLARRTAVAQTMGRDRPYDKARALQDFFRNDGPNGFTYDTMFNLGHNEDAIEAFLRERRGFCEQFAGTFAAMARSIGLPSRVAVGFTHGVARNPDEPSLYEVTARQTHAWPEVYLGHYG